MTKPNKTEQCFCQSYYDDNGILQNCTCGKCGELEWEKEFKSNFYVADISRLDNGNLWLHSVISFIHSLLASQRQKYIEEMEREKKQHLDNIRLWENSVLTPTEPDEEERSCVVRELKACVYTISRCQEIVKGKL
jgi:hypothetical protein